MKRLPTNPSRSPSRATGPTRLFALLLALGCASLGAETAFPDPVQTSGVGPFRPLDTTETGLSADPAGRVQETSGASDGGMRAGDFFFSVESAPLADAPGRTSGLPLTAVDWARFEPRRIARAAKLDGTHGFGPGTVVLEASEAWEGDAVFEPWAVVLPDGRARLYYAAEGGIGAAEAPSLGGSFTKVDGPILEDARAPSVVVNDDGYLLYFERDGAIGVATSADGLAFSVQGMLDLEAPEPTDLEEALEVSFHRPGAVWASTVAHDRILRLYFEVVRDDRTFSVTMAASLDGRDFERLPTSVYGGNESSGAPAPFLLEDGTTLLHFTVDARGDNGEPFRAPVVGVAPSFVRFADPPVEE
ncbi:MAG: hypothetical protein H6721_26010 [Sandaracinus sp.]|nr:hypothetical protein [Myxococcales bacterium]MCB9635589.1 hypothetical protein [Sandaracinus sp.]